VNIPNEDLKRAVLEADITHPDVMLRVLASIDGDVDFRDALVAAVMTKDPKAIPTLAYGHFRPIEVKHHHGHPIDKPKEKLPPLKTPVSARQLMQLLNDRTVLIASKLLANGTIDGVVTSWVKSRLTALVDAVIGVEDDGFNRVRLTTRHGRNTPILGVIQTHIEQAAKPAIEQALDAMDFTSVTNKLAVKAHQEIQRSYERACNEYISARAKEWAAEQAKLDCEELFEKAESKLREDDGCDAD
jgi:hypothetical protein